MDLELSILFTCEEKNIKLIYNPEVSHVNLATVILYVRDLFEESAKMSQNGEQVGVEDILKNLHTNIEVHPTSGLTDSSSYEVWINAKNQLVKIQTVCNMFKPPGEDEEKVHEVIEFNVDLLPQALQHQVDSQDPVVSKKSKTKIFDYGSRSYSTQNEETKEEVLGDEDAPTFGGAALKSRKVPVKDGVSQHQFIIENKAAKALVKDPNTVFITSAEVKKHRKANDCWTIYDGKVYDITSYIASHPGGKKILAGAGKDCTKLYNDYHPWVNIKFICGKLQIGVLKD
ncbi:unnamed protein product [Moneuplotes crassus]|uniref:Cytochrome b5 heme-binding domain-containing protein n=2 Tax=Euplotes crassus TaxID=5936 RepID=A0AAD1XQB9_EUPCR|nr:unnamed protein product [Moneuplotes crassus]